LIIDLDRRGREPREYNIRSKVNTSAFADDWFVGRGRIISDIDIT